MSPTSELRYVMRDESGFRVLRQALQQKWVQHHIPPGQTEAPFEWRDIPIVEDEK